VPPYQAKQRTMRAAAATTAVLTAVGMTSTSALADPPPPATASEALQQLQELSHQAEQLTEDYKKAQDDRATKKVDLDRANADVAGAQQLAGQARAEEDKHRSQIDTLSRASYEGARLNKLSALLTSQSVNDYLDRAGTMETLAKNNDDAVQQFHAAADQAQLAERQTQDASGRATQAEADAATIEGQLAAKKAAMDAQIAKTKDLYDNLSAQEKAALQSASTNVPPPPAPGVPPPSTTNVPPPASTTSAAITAVNAALSRLGDPYVWGATGPDQFDCSGLVQWSYLQAGISLPRSTYSQVTVGTSVSISQMQPGDLVFFYSDYSHVGIYVGNGNVVHAPTEGETVQVTPYSYIGAVTAVRRVAG
jgi:cell wall-associated NlpC family hydrolase